MKSGPGPSKASKAIENIMSKTRSSILGLGTRSSVSGAQSLDLRNNVGVPLWEDDELELEDTVNDNLPVSMSQKDDDFQSDDEKDLVLNLESSYKSGRKS